MLNDSLFIFPLVVARSIPFIQLRRSAN